MVRVTGLALLPFIALAACGCAGSERVANGAFELGAFHVEGQYDVEQVGSLCSRCVDAWKTSGVVMGWIADGYSGEVMPNAAFSVDSLSLHAISDSTGGFALAVPPDAIGSRCATSAPSKWTSTSNSRLERSWRSVRGWEPTGSRVASLHTSDGDGSPGYSADGAVAPNDQGSDSAGR